MTQLTITTDNKNNAKFLAKMLKSINFVKSVKTENYELSNEEIQLLEERSAEYKKNPQNVKSWEVLRKEMKKKYGF